MDYFGLESSRKNRKEKSEFDKLEEMEMCDICGHNYHFTQIQRVNYCNRSGTIYRIRVCPYCNVKVLTDKL